MSLDSSDLFHAKPLHPARKLLHWNLYYEILIFKYAIVLIRNHKTHKKCSPTSSMIEGHPNLSYIDLTTDQVDEKSTPRFYQGTIRHTVGPHAICLRHLFETDGLMSVVLSTFVVDLEFVLDHCILGFHNKGVLFIHKKDSTGEILDTASGLTLVFPSTIGEDDLGSDNLGPNTSNKKNRVDDQDLFKDANQSNSAHHLETADSNLRIKPSEHNSVNEISQYDASKIKRLGRKKRSGIMHSKFYLLFYKDRLRLVISSANLIRCDFEEVMNVLFIQDLPLATHTCTSSIDSTDIEVQGNIFKDEFAQYITKMGIPNPIDFNRLLDKYDWTDVKVSLVHSSPRIESSGLSLFSKKLHHQCFEPGIKRTRQILDVQCSSIGFPDPHWEREFMYSIGDPKVKNSALNIIFPTMAYAEKWGGQDSFGTIFGPKIKFTTSGIRKFYQCESICPKIAPALHSKIFIYDVEIVNEDNQHQRKRWYYLGSANFSKAAWGRVGQRPANWELGIILDESYIESIGGFPLPYITPINSLLYRASDTPWCQ